MTLPSHGRGVSSSTTTNQNRQNDNEYFRKNVSFFYMKKNIFGEQKSLTQVRPIALLLV
jgi:hypothetical protein